MADKRGEKASGFLSGSVPWLTSFYATCDVKTMIKIKTLWICVGRRPRRKTNIITSY